MTQDKKRCHKWHTRFDCFWLYSLKKGMAITTIPLFNRKPTAQRLFTGQQQGVIVLTVKVGRSLPLEGQTNYDGALYTCRCRSKSAASVYTVHLWLLATLLLFMTLQDGNVCLGGGIP